VNRLEGQVMRQLELIEKMKLDHEIRASEGRPRQGAYVSSLLHDRLLHVNRT
jgi:hypothetical protein